MNTIIKEFNRVVLKTKDLTLQYCKIKDESEKLKSESRQRTQEHAREISQLKASHEE